MPDQGKYGGPSFGGPGAFGSGLDAATIAAIEEDEQERYAWANMLAQEGMKVSSKELPASIVPTVEQMLEWNPPQFHTEFNTNIPNPMFSPDARKENPRAVFNNLLEEPSSPSGGFTNTDYSPTVEMLNQVDTTPSDNPVHNIIGEIFDINNPTSHTQEETDSLADELVTYNQEAVSNVVSQSLLDAAARKKAEARARAKALAKEAARVKAKEEHRAAWEAQRELNNPSDDPSPALNPPPTSALKPLSYYQNTASNKRKLAKKQAQAAKKIKNPVKRAAMIKKSKINAQASKSAAKTSRGVEGVDFWAR